jgi:hypothetical protein
MKRIQVRPNYYLDEFIDPHTYFNTPDHGRSLIDERIFDVAQTLRYLLGRPLGINNWWGLYNYHKNRKSQAEIIEMIEESPNHYKWSGIRTERTNVGASRSAHRVIPSNGMKGLAIDPKGNQHELFAIVKKHAEVFYAMGVRRLEDPKITPGWLHLDLLEKNTRPNSIRVIDRISATQTIKF